MREETERFAARHDAWASAYDAHLQAVLGTRMASLTRRTLAVVREASLEEKAVVEFGAGPGHIAIPLAREGWEVTAVDPSGAMLGLLSSQAERAKVRIETAQSTIEEFEPTRTYDAVLCLSSALNRVLRDSDLERAARVLAQCVRPRGIVLVNLASRSLLAAGGSSPLPGDPDLYTCAEADGEKVPLRFWPMTRIEQEFGWAELKLSDDLSARFRDGEAEYLLFRKPSFAGR